MKFSRKRTKLFWKEINEVRNKSKKALTNVKTLVENAERVDKEMERRQFRVEENILEKIRSKIVELLQRMKSRML